MKIFSIVLATLLAIAIIACNSNSNKKEQLEALTVNMEKAPVQQDKANNEAEFNADSIAAPQIPDQTGDDKKQKQEPISKEIKIDWDKKIIKTALINLEIKDYSSFYASIREKVKNIGGYIAQEEQTQSEYKIENSMTIKVPVDQFDNAVAQLTVNAEKINERKISSQDVTTDIVDTKSRMEAKKQVRQRYMDLLGQAKNMNDILSIQSEINGIQEEIESAAGRIEYLSHSSVFSTINLTYYQVLNVAAKENEDQHKPSFGEKIKEAFSAGWDIVSNLFIVIITVWPLLLVSFGLFVLYKRLRNHRSAKTDKIMP